MIFKKKRIPILPKECSSQVNFENSQGLKDSSRKKLIFIQMTLYHSKYIERGGFRKHPYLGSRAGILPHFSNVKPWSTKRNTYQGLRCRGSMGSTKPIKFEIWVLESIKIWEQIKQNLIDFLKNFKSFLLILKTNKNFETYQLELPTEPLHSL